MEAGTAPVPACGSQDGSERRAMCGCGGQPSWGGSGDTREHGCIPLRAWGAKSGSACRAAHRDVRLAFPRRPCERRPLSPAPAEVHVWTACAADPSLVEECRRLLSDREADRAARFIFERDRTMAVVSRGLRRMVLGWYAQADPRALGFIEGAHGKPALAGAGSAVRFN